MRILFDAMCLGSSVNHFNLYVMGKRSYDGSDRISINLRKEIDRIVMVDGWIFEGSQFSVE